MNPSTKRFTIGGLRRCAAVAEGHSLDSIRVATEYAAASPDYDPVFGNIAFGMSGHLQLGTDGTLAGTVGTITVQADKLLHGAIADGRFFIDPALPGGVGGVLTGYQESYRDGSTLVINGFAAEVAGLGDLGSIYANPSLFGGSDDIDIDLPGRLHEQLTVQAGAGDDHISLKGGGGLLGVDAGAGNDTIVLQGDAHAVDGGAGLDVARMVLARASANVQPVKDAVGATTGFSVTDQGGVTVQLTNVERIVFADGAWALDIDGNAGQAYRLYQAAFNRAPDDSGLGFWINALDQGYSLPGVAQGFVDSQEYRAAYGAAQGNRELVNKFYENILHRAPDASGLEFWIGVLDQNLASVAEVLAAISESGENREGMAALIGNGFAYTPYA